MKRLLKTFVSLAIVMVITFLCSVNCVGSESLGFDIYREERKVLNAVKGFSVEVAEIRNLLNEGSLDDSVIEDLIMKMSRLEVNVRCSLNYEGLRDIFKELKNEVSTLKTKNSEIKKEETYKKVLGYIPTEDEIYMLKCVVEAEVGGLCFDHKMLSTQVVVNRVLSDEFSESTLRGVLTAKNQFSTIGNYYNNYRPVSKSTSDAVDTVLCGGYEDKSCGALYYYSPKYCKNKKTVSWFENDLTFLFEIEGVRYFK